MLLRTYSRAREGSGSLPPHLPFKQNLLCKNGPFVTLNKVFENNGLNGKEHLHSIMNKDC